jgi:DNA-binding NtrC family response regulator
LTAKLPKPELGIGLAIIEARVPGHSNGINPPKSIDCESGASDMEEPVVVVNANVEQCQELCAVLEQEHFRTTALHSLMALEGEVKEGSCRVVILDLDSLPVDNFLFRSLKRNNPGIHIVGLSSRPFHPELEEAMSRHISSCLSKPVDVEELVYWIRSICQS